jgi:hypothetical protein
MTARLRTNSRLNFATPVDLHQKNIWLRVNTMVSEHAQVPNEENLQLKKLETLKTLFRRLNEMQLSSIDLVYEFYKAQLTEGAKVDLQECYENFAGRVSFPDVDFENVFSSKNYDAEFC